MLLNKNYLIVISCFLVFLPILLFVALPKATMNELIAPCAKGASETDYQKSRSESYRYKHCLPVEEPKEYSKRILSGEKIVDGGSYGDERSKKPARVDGRLVITLEARPATRDGKTLSPPPADRFLEHTSLRYTYGIAFFVLLAANVWAVIWATLAGWRISPQFPRRKLLSVLALLISLLLAFEFLRSSLLELLFGWDFVWFRDFATAVSLPSIFGISDVAKLIVDDPLNKVHALISNIDAPAGHGFRQFLNAFQVMRSSTLAITTAAFLWIVGSLAACTLLAKCDNAEELHRNRKQLDGLLTVTAILFAVFIFYIRAYLQMAYPFIVNVQDAQLLGNSLLQYWGASASLVLLISFGLAFWVHQTQARILAASEATTEARMRKSQEAGAEKDLWQRLLDLLKIVLPLLTGVAFEISSVFGV